MAGGGGLAQQVAEKLADLIQVSPNIENVNPSQSMY